MVRGQHSNGERVRAERIPRHRMVARRCHRALKKRIVATIGRSNRRRESPGGKLASNDCNAALVADATSKALEM
jgi:hypothetical protein